MNLNFKVIFKLIVFIVVGYLISVYLLPYFSPFILALILSLFIEPLVKFLQVKLRMSRGLAVASVMLVGLGLIFFFISAIVFSLVSELIQLSYQLPRYQTDMQAFINSTVAEAKYFYNFRLSPSMVEAINQNIGAITTSLQTFVVSTTESVLNLLSGVPQGITGVITLLVVSLLASFFISKDKDLLLNVWLKVTPGNWGRKILAMTQTMMQAFMKYLKAQLILISITTVVTIFGLYLIGAEYALTMGLLTGFFDLIPILGPSIIMIPWIIWAFVSGSSVFAVKLLILYAVILIIRQLLEAKVVADSLGIHPLATLVSIYMGLKLFGVMGMIIGPLMVIALQAAARSGVITSFYVKK